MKKLKLLTASLLVLVLLFTACGSCGVETDPALKGVDATFDGFTKVDETTYFIAVSNATENLNFGDAVTAIGKSGWVLADDIEAKNIIPSKVGALSVGDNMFYVLVTAPKGDTKLYTLVVRRRAVFTVAFNTLGGTAVPSQQVEEDGRPTLPAPPVREGFTFNGWHFDFENGAIKSDTTITASWTAVDAPPPSDTAAPVLVSIADWQIPTRWGKSVYKMDVDEPTGLAVVDTAIVFPYPEYIAGEGSQGLARVGFEIRDTLNNNAVIKIYDLYNLSGTADNTYRYNPDILTNGYYVTEAAAGAYQPVAFTREGLAFDFKHYFENRDGKLPAGFDGLGKYTVQYQAYGKEQGISTKAYDITLEQEFKDFQRPAVIADFDKYIYYGSAGAAQNYTVPTVTATDNQSLRLKIDYTIATADGSSLNVASGEVISIVREGAKIFVRNAAYAAATAADKAKLSLEITGADELLFTVQATDSVGNVGGWGYGYEPMSRSDNGTVRFVIPDKLPAFDLEIVTGPFSYTYTDETGVQTVAFLGITDTPVWEAPNPHSNIVNLGSFAIKNVPDAYANFYGFEVALQKNQDDGLPQTLYDTIPLLI